MKRVTIVNIRGNIFILGEDIKKLFTHFFLFKKPQTFSWRENYFSWQNVVLHLLLPQFQKPIR